MGRVVAQRLTGPPLVVGEGLVKSVAFSPSGTGIAAGYTVAVPGVYAGGTVWWDAATRKRLAEEPIALSEGHLTSVAFSPDGKTRAAGYIHPRRSGGGFGFRSSGGVAIWDSGSRERLADGPTSLRAEPTSSVAFSGDGRTLAAGYDGGAVLWDTTEGERLAKKSIAVKADTAMSVAFSSDGKKLTVYSGGKVEVWDAAGGESLASGQFHVKEGTVARIAFSPGGETAAAGYYASAEGGYSGGVVLWDVDGQKRLAEKPLAVGESHVTSVAFSPDGKRIGAGFGASRSKEGGGVVLWDRATGRRLGKEPLALTKGYVNSVAFSRDGEIVAAGSEGGGYRVVLWDLASGDPGTGVSLAVKEGPVTSVAVSPDGETLAAGYEGYNGGGVVLWSVSSRERKQGFPLSMKEGSVLRVAFSPDSATIAAGYGGNATGTCGVVLWDMATRKRLREDPFVVKKESVRSLAFSPDGKILATAFSTLREAGEIAQFDVDLESWKRIAGEIANRNFTREESRLYFPDEDYRRTFPELPIPP